MSPEKQRIAIAEACPNLVEWHDGEPYWRGMWSSVGEGNEHLAEFHPLHDLNAMHEAEKLLLQWDDDKRDHGDRSYWGKYCDALGRIGAGGLARNIHASAPQRAEAFLHTICQWMDAP